MSNDILDQEGMFVGIEEYDEGSDDIWDDRFECGCCGCCGCSCNWELGDEREFPQDIQE